jgi:glutamyl-tRNA synthetase
VLPDHLQQRLLEGERLRRLGCRGRYAPSPTGRQHLGNLRTALLSWLITRLQGGEWLLRIDDLDTPRNRPDAEASILADLSWLGLDWDGPVIRQSERRGLYASVLSWLRRQGLLYPCRCSRRMLADISAPHGKAAAYPGICRGRALGWGEREGRLPSWRLALQSGWISWDEQLADTRQLDAQRDVGDVVLRRSDGFLAYHLATAVDELTLGIADVVRGQDLWTSTAPQLAVMAALGGSIPRYWHVPLRLDTQGQRMAKRDGGLGLNAWRQEGLDSAAVVGRLAAELDLVPPGSRLSCHELLQQSAMAALQQQLRRNP